jgi:hypothetical protein
LARWSCPELAREAVAQDVAEAISASTVRRWLAREAIKPWQYRSWLFSRDPDFAVKAEQVLDLYQRRWKGTKLEAVEYVISSDEKTSIQARVFGSCAPSTGIVPFMALAEQVMTQQPYASAKRVIWVVDNGSSHRGHAAIYFSVVQRKVVSPNDFTNLDEVEQRLTAFEQRYNATAKPFQWKFTRADLHDLPDRINQHEQQQTTPSFHPPHDQPPKNFQIRSLRARR